MSAVVETIGRRTGTPRRAEVWFVETADEFRLLAHRESSWWRNRPIALAIGSRRIDVERIEVSESAELLDETLELFRGKYGASSVAQWYEGTARKVVRLRRTPGC